jgi:hypothetical protein
VRRVIIPISLAIFMTILAAWMTFSSTSRYAAPIAAAALFVALLNCCIAIAYRMKGGSSRQE